MIEAYSWYVHDVDPEELDVGDHIYTWVSMFHTSHGLVYKILEATDPPVHDGEAQDDLLDRIIVLHLSFDEDRSGAEIRCTSLRTFLSCGSKGLECGLKRARYEVSRAEHMMKLPGTCYPFEPSSIVDVLRRAEALIQASELHPYNLRSLTQANCEHIIVWCKTGQWRSFQVENVVALARRAVFVLAGIAACRGASSGPGSQGPSLLAPLIGGALLWKVTQQDVDDAERRDMPPPFVSNAELRTCAILPGSATKHDLAQVHIATGKGAESFSKDVETNTEEDDDADYVVIEDMRASKEFIVVPNIVPPAIRVAQSA
jgi:hypothetical protein